MKDCFLKPHDEAEDLRVYRTTFNFRRKAKHICWWGAQPQFDDKTDFDRAQFADK